MANEQELEYLLGQMDEEMLKKAVNALAMKFKKDKVVEVVRDTLKQSVILSRSEVIGKAEFRLESFNEEIYFYSNMKQVDPDKYYSVDEASIVIAESIADEFYETGELMMKLGLVDETKDYVRNIVDGIKQCKDGKKAILLKTAPDFTDSYCDGLLAGLESDDILKGFGMKN